jgi:predicted site-specific integrase-resolvase
MLDVNPVGNEEIADWLELAIIASGEKGNTIHKLNEWASSLCGLSDHQVALALNVIERRSAILNDKYPFEINEYAVVFHKERLNCGYTYLLAISRPSYTAAWQNPSPTQEDSDLFEEFVSCVSCFCLRPFGLN